MLGCGSRTGLTESVEQAALCGGVAPISMLVVGPTIDSHHVLLRFNPAAATFSAVGSVDCLGPGPPQPTAMAVGRDGTAYIAGAGSSIDRQLYRVSTSTAACDSFGFRLRSFDEFAFAYAGGGAGGLETLYFVDAFFTLGRIDLAGLALDNVGILSQVSVSLLTGTAAGDLFAFTNVDPRVPPLPPGPPRSRSPVPPPVPPSIISRIDPATGVSSPAWTVPDAPAIPWRGLAFSGGDFYFFGPSDAVVSVGTDVWRFRPANGTFVRVAHVDAETLAVGVPTCPPPLARPSP
jgi:hypothetical protein